MIKIFKMIMIFMYYILFSHTQSSVWGNFVTVIIILLCFPIIRTEIA